MHPIDDIITNYSNKDNWVDFKKLYSQAADCRLWFMIGARRIGKTDCLLHMALDLWLRHGRKTMWIRDVLETVKSKNFLNDFLNDAYEFGWISDEEGEWIVKEDGVHEPKNGEIVIKFQSLSTYSSRRGPAHPDVDLMVYDEFIPEDRRFQKGCLKGLMSLTKTVFSGRDGCRCICTSNYVSISNPYFAGLEIYPDPKKDVTVWSDKGVAVERCRGYRCAITKESPWNKVYSAAHYGDYADEEEDVMHKLVKKVPKGAKPDDWTLQIYGKWYRCYTATDGIRYARREKEEVLNRLKIVRYVTNPADLTEGVVKLDTFKRVQIEMDVDGGRMKFEDANTLFAFINLIYNI